MMSAARHSFGGPGSQVTFQLDDWVLFHKELALADALLQIEVERMGRGRVIRDSGGFPSVRLQVRLGIAVVEWAIMLNPGFLQDGKHFYQLQRTRWTLLSPWRRRSVSFEVLHVYTPLEVQSMDVLPADLRSAIEA